MPLVQIVENFFTAVFDSAIMIPCVYVILYPLEKWFTSYFELMLWVQNYAQFHCLDLDLWLANFKICFLFCLGGLFSCGCPVNGM